MRRPQIQSYQFIVGHAELVTGHVLKSDRTLYLQDGEVYLVLDSRNEAMNYRVKTIADHPEIECWTENSTGQHIKLFMLLKQYSTASNEEIMNSLGFASPASTFQFLRKLKYVENIGKSRKSRWRLIN